TAGIDPRPTFKLRHYLDRLLIPILLPPPRLAPKVHHGYERIWSGLLLPPGQRLGGRVDLVVVPAGGKGRELGDIVGEPGRRVRQPDKTVLDRRRLRMQPHDLVAFRGTAPDVRQPGIDQVLDELRPRRPILDQDRLGPKPAVLLDDGAPE